MDDEVSGWSIDSNRKLLQGARLLEVGERWRSNSSYYSHRWQYWCVIISFRLLNWHSMEWFPESWFWEPFDGPFAYEVVPYISIHEDYSQQDNYDATARQIYQCLLCETGEMNSERVCKEHVCSSRHQKRYKLLYAQQRSFFQEMKLPENFALTMEVRDENDDRALPSQPPFDNSLPYILPFRRWQYGRWRFGSSCRLCGTAALPTRMAVVQHFQTSKRHQSIRSRTFWQHHPEFGRLEPRIDLLCQLYQWHVERAMIAYVAEKEASHGGLASHPYAWYQLLWTLETYELRERMVHLELAIWKYSLLHYTDSTSFASVKELLVFFLKPQEDTNAPNIADYWKVKRVTSGAMQIIQCVIPFLRKYPKLWCNYWSNNITMIARAPWNPVDHLAFGCDRSHDGKDTQDFVVWHHWFARPLQMWKDDWYWAFQVLPC